MKSYEIDFGGNVLCGINVDGENITIIGAVNGYGQVIKLSEINICTTNESGEICTVCNGKAVVLGFPKDQKCYKCNGTGKLSTIA